MENKELTNKVEEKMPLSDIFYRINKNGKIEILQNLDCNLESILPNTTNIIYHVIEDHKVEPYITEKLIDYYLDTKLDNEIERRYWDPREWKWSSDPNVLKKQSKQIHWNPNKKRFEEK